MPRHIVVKFHNSENKKKNPKIFQNVKIHNIQRDGFQNGSEFFNRILEARR